MQEKDNQEFYNRYNNFKNNNLPTCFWDNDRQTVEFVWFNNDQLEIEKDLTYALGEIAKSSLYYPFIDRHLEGNSEEYNQVIGHNHAHSFEEVINALYNSPETFKIEKEDEKYYSSQELQYIYKIQKYLLFIDLKDNLNNNSKNRYQNKKHEKYINCRRITLTQEKIEKIINKESDYLIFKYLDYNFKPYEALILNEEGEYCLHVLVKNSSKLKYKEIKDKYNNEKINENDDVELNQIEVIEIFK